jgi:hypothetical protein
VVPKGGAGRGDDGGGECDHRGVAVLVPGRQLHDEECSGGANGDDEEVPGRVPQDRGDACFAVVGRPRVGRMIDNQRWWRHVQEDFIGIRPRSRDTPNEVPIVGWLDRFVEMAEVRLAYARIRCSATGSIP